MKLLTRLLVCVLLSTFVLIGVTGCGKSEEPPVGTQSNFSSVQQYKYLTARLYGLMTFDYSGTQVNFPTELTISSVPLTWMGQIFDGKVVNNGPGNDMTDTVHGSVSTDGGWILSLSYSRQVARTGGKSVFYRINMKNIPITVFNNGTVETKQFEKQGDVQKYIEKIEYNDGLYDGTTITPAITYVSTDWANTGVGVQPSLKLAFEIKPSITLGPMPPPQPGMGMGR